MSQPTGREPPTAQVVECLRLLKAITSELQRLDSWAAQPPPAERFASTLPFCVDTLSLEQWLQFVFLPRMQALIDAGAALPTGAGLAPYAEVCFRDRLVERHGLIRLLSEMDALLVQPVRH